MTVNELIVALDLLPADVPVVFLEDGRELERVFLSQDARRVVLSGDQG